ncbi:MAG: hypothetical protein JST11_27360 [Acidobacteria bacterium]|nr:hypothetical protein [Acidobacteriota bacterium]
MSVFAPHTTLRKQGLPMCAALAAIALLATSCSTTTVSAKAGSADYYWTAARTTYAAGDYAKTVENLDHVLDSPEYASRAIPWSLVLTTGMAAGYAEIAADYAKGARSADADAVFHRKAAEYLNVANPLVLAAAHLVDKLAQQPSGSITLVFGRPRGSLAPPPVLYRIAAGQPVSPADAEAAPAVAVERNILLSASAAVGAPNDSAKASEILSHASTLTPRATFAKAMADMLEKASTIYSRDQLDYPDKLAMVADRVRALRDVAADKGPATAIRVNAQ